MEEPMIKLRDSIQQFLMEEIGDVYVTDAEGQFVDTIFSGKPHFSEKAMRAWELCCPEAERGQKGEVWEFSDVDESRYFSVTTDTVDTEEGQFQLHHVMDVTNYSDLFRRMSGMYKDWERMSKFQQSILQKLSDGYEVILADIAQILKTDEVWLCISGVHVSEETGYSAKSKSICRTRVRAWKDLPDIEAGETKDGRICLLKGVVEENHYALLIRDGEKVDRGMIDNPMLISAVHLFVENGLLRMQIVYTSEHDAMTGLYNKGKYMNLLENAFGKPETIAIFNMDVNFLKRANDNYGHETGDELIKRTARSIQLVERDDVLGFRIGGDEFMMIGLNISFEEAQKLRKEWEKAVEKQNDGTLPVEIVVSCGMTFGEGDYSLHDLLVGADEKMYIDKKLKKGGRT